jgi:hypothetical protein
VAKTTRWLRGILLADHRGVIDAPFIRVAMEAISGSTTASPPKKSASDLPLHMTHQAMEPASGSFNPTSSNSGHFYETCTRV